MIQVTRHVSDLNDRMDMAVLLIDETHASGGEISQVEREAKGLAIVMLFAAYEHLLRSLTRTLLDGAIRCRVSNKRLRPGMMTFALIDRAHSTRDSSAKKLYSKSLPDLIETMNTGRSSCTINPDAFPDDGSFMRSSQVRLWCQIFDVGPPGAILRRTWASLDAVVAQRNAVAHGEQTAGEVGRQYTEAEIRALIENWRLDWTDFLNHVGARASTRDFFRRP